MEQVDNNERCGCFLPTCEWSECQNAPDEWKRGAINDHLAKFSYEDRAHEAIRILMASPVSVHPAFDEAPF